jgi:hypothetical protein
MTDVRRLTDTVNQYRITHIVADCLMSKLPYFNSRVLADLLCPPLFSATVRHYKFSPCYCYFLRIFVTILQRRQK